MHDRKIYSLSLLKNNRVSPLPFSFFILSVSTPFLLSSFYTHSPSLSLPQSTLTLLLSFLPSISPSSEYLIHSSMHVIIPYLHEVVVGSRIRLQVQFAEICTAHTSQHSVEDVVVSLPFKLQYRYRGRQG